MKIQKISALTSRVQNYIKKAENRFCPKWRFPLSENADTFCRHGYSLSFPRYSYTSNEVKKILNELTPTSYRKLSPGKLELVRSQISDNTADNAECVVNMSKMLKNIFDNKFGESNYVFVSVGRSLSAVSQCMQFLGVKTRRLPFSGCARHYYRGISNDIVKQNKFYKYKTFLETQLAHTDDKKYIFCDYASSGSTLKTFKELLNHPEVQLGSKDDVFLDINRVLYKVNKKNPILHDEVYNFAFKLSWQNFDIYADIGYLYYKDLGKVSKSLKPDHPMDAKSFRFCLMDILSQGNK